MMKKYIPTSFLLIFGSLLAFYSCSEKVSLDNPGNNKYTTVEINLTDAPGDFQEVNIDIQSVQVQLGDSSWRTLTTNSGFYDLLLLQNGLDTTIVSDSLSQGVSITSMRLLLGDSNTVMVDSTYHTLKVPSGSSSGYKILFQDSLTADSLAITLDFDAEKSIVKKGNKNEYILKPVVKAL